MKGNGRRRDANEMVVPTDAYRMGATLPGREDTRRDITPDRTAVLLKEARLVCTVLHVGDVDIAPDI